MELSGSLAQGLGGTRVLGSDGHGGERMLERAGKLEDPGEGVQSGEMESQLAWGFLCDPLFIPAACGERATRCRST